MRTGKSLIGLSVVAQDSGQNLGTIKDLFFDHEADELLAIVLSERDLFGLIDAAIVPWYQVRSAGGDVILVESSRSKIKLKEEPRTLAVAQRETVLSGTQVLTSDGQKIGTLADMCIDENTGKVLGYEVSGGFISDTLRGKKFLPSPPGLAIGEDAAIAPPATEATLKRETE